MSQVGNKADSKEGKNMNNLQIEFSTSEYKMSHCKNPSGYGRWAFQEGKNCEIFAPYSMTLTEAKRWYKEFLKGQGVEGYFVIKVCP